ncbi:MAG: DUF7133 domain-containing protein [Verrucomicrobiaceae bacterium]
MTFRSLTALLFTAATTVAVAQNGDNKNHDKMGDIVPEVLIPKAPVLSVEDALKSFTIHPDFTIEAVVAEPLVDKPVALTFDNRGRMWVTEMRGYMADIDGTTEDIPEGRIVILEDTTGDGSVDKRTVFLEKLLLPRSIALVPNGVLFADQESLYFVARDGDKPKGDPVIVDQTYAKGGNVEHKPNGMMPALDNWMYNAKSDTRYKWIDGKLVSQKTTFRGQWGISQDNFGRLYHNSNSTLLIGDRIMPNLLLGNDAVKIKTNISSRAGSNAVFPGRVTPGLNRAYISSHNGYDSNTINPKTFKLTNATGACGPVIYRGDQFPAQYQNWAFVCESSAQLVKAIEVSHTGGKVTGTHPIKGKDFLTSADERFRPVNAYTAPDGSLYILDMYHGIIQHKTYMTTYLRRQTLSRGLEGPGFGHGRIYRVKAKNQPLKPMANLAEADAKALAMALLSGNGTHRDLAQKEILNRKAADAIPFLRKLIRGDFPAHSKAHAVWTLEGLGVLNTADINAAIESANEDLTASAAYAALSLPRAELSHLTPVASSLPETPAILPYKARLLATIPVAEAQEALVDLLSKHKKAAFVREAAIAGQGHHGKLFVAANDGRFKDKQFDAWMKDTLNGPKKEVDPASLLKGLHLASYKRGQEIYLGKAACIGCHGPDGEGLPNLGPTLNASDWVTGPEDRLVKILLHGLQGPIHINGKKFTPQAFMPGLGQNPTISDADIADIATFIRSGWENRASLVTAETVTNIRKDTEARNNQMYSEADFKK